MPQDKCCRWSKMEKIHWSRLTSHHQAVKLKSGGMPTSVIDWCHTTEWINAPRSGQLEPTCILFTWQSQMQGFGITVMKRRKLLLAETSCSWLLYSDNDSATFSRYIITEPTDEHCPLVWLSPLWIHKALTAAVGTLTSDKTFRSGTILVHTITKIYSDKLCLAELAGVPVKAIHTGPSTHQ